MVITITGSTGTIGSELVRLLSQANVSTRAVMRDGGKARPLPNVAWTQADLREERVLEPAIAGTTRLFLLTGNDAGFGAIQIGVLRAAQQLGMAHVVKLSALGASSHSNSMIAREHWDVEQVIQQMPVTWTILRPHAFMQNWLDDVAESVRAERKIYTPIGDGRVPFIDARDIAEVAREALLHPEVHSGKRYFLTGGEAVGYGEVAAAISEAIGKPVTYGAISMDEARARAERRGMPTQMIDALLAIAAYQKAGGPTAKVSDAVQRILHRSPRTVRDFARDYAERFR